MNHLDSQAFSLSELSLEVMIGIVLLATGVYMYKTYCGTYLARLAVALVAGDIAAVVEPETRLSARAICQV